MLDDHFNVERLVRAMVLRFRAIADSSYSAVSRHLPTVSRHQHPHSDTLSHHCGQSYLDELAADGKTAPNAAMTGSSTFRIKCGEEGFYHDSLDVPHQSSTGDQHQVRTKVPRVSYTGDNFASMSSVLNKWLFRKMPDSRSCDEFSRAHPDCPLHTEGS